VSDPGPGWSDDAIGPSEARMIAMNERLLEENARLQRELEVERTANKITENHNHFDCAVAMAKNDIAINQVVEAYRALDPQMRYVMDLHFGDLDNALWRLFAERAIDVDETPSPDGLVRYA
jgi:hypothetical protein